MQSKWYSLKGDAVALRKKGNSIRKIEIRLCIPRSTLSYWFKDIKLSPQYESALRRKREQSLIAARAKAVLWHNEEKRKRMAKAEAEASETMRNADCRDETVLEIALAMLYLGEGFKGNASGIGNSNPAILKFFIAAVEKLYGFSRKDMKCFLHLRADQNPKKLKKIWSGILDIPLKNFISASIDRRTEGKPSYKTYLGVCVLSIGNLAIQRKLLYLSGKYIARIIG